MLRKTALYPVAAFSFAAIALGAWASVAASSVAASSAPASSLAVPVQYVAPASSPASADAGSGVNLRRTVTVEVVEKTKNAVVNISTRKLVNQRVTFGGDPFWQPFDTGQVIRVPANSLGSGFIIQKDGYVVTNNHVVDKAREISVELANGQKLPADLISADPDADLAILRIHSDTPLPTLELGDSSDLMIGEPVIAVGNPLGFSHSVSTGIVSALHRDIEPHAPDQPTNQPVRGEEAALRDLIQTDAAINPGNSGGPLLNAYGQVIGMNTAIRGDAQNIGFAIPIDRLRDLIPELMNPSQVTKVDVPLKLIEKRRIIEPATVNAVVLSAGPDGRVLTSINGQHPANIVDAYAMLLDVKANQPFNVIWRGAQPQMLLAKATPIPDAIVQAKDRFGMTIEQVTPMLADKYHLTQEEGLLVAAVDRNGAAAKSGIQPGDIIVQMGRVRLATLNDFGALAPRLPGSGQARVWVIRGQEMGYITLKF
jgi:serine protease Do